MRFAARLGLSVVLSPLTERKYDVEKGNNDFVPVVIGGRAFYVVLSMALELAYDPCLLAACNGAI